MVIMMPPTLPALNCHVPGFEYMPNGCSRRATSSAPINTCTLVAEPPDISSIATSSAMTGTYSMKFACARIALRSLTARQREGASGR